ncbi:peroxidase family protein [Desulfobacterota bacterium AH_259_B03_O07]|nr:peroxidase family protein [Desulfobacterota bacterium AH_259_B03_O07]
MQVQVIKKLSLFFLVAFLGLAIALISCDESQRQVPSEPSQRSIDGIGNNLEDPEMGAAFTQLLRLVESDYADGISELAGQDRPDTRTVSNAVNAQEESIPNTLRASDYFWQWGQFLDHDIDLTGGAEPPEPANILVPSGDPFFDPEGTGTQVIEFNRSIYDSSTGTDINNPREQLNEITGWIDASNVYGSDDERAFALRTNDGTGRLKTSEGNLLPFNIDGFPNAGGPSDTLFLAGDVRANEQVALTALHTLFVREHNRLAEVFASEHPDWDGDQIYEKARQIIGAQMQVITYMEFLPALLGQGVISPYLGYDPTVNARIFNLFSTAAFRFGHSALSPTLLRLDSEGNEVPDGSLSLRDAFFSPQRITDEGGIDPILRGLASQLCQSIDPYIVDDVRNFLFGDPGSGGFDLASLNIQRGRDHGQPSYNDVREALGLNRAESFVDISLDPDIQERLASVYDSVDDIDLWVGGLSEDPLPNSHVGELFHTIIKKQFEALRDGDRFWYELTLSRRELREVENTKLSDIIRRNTDIGEEILDDVFHVSDGN